MAAEVNLNVAVRKGQESKGSLSEMRASKKIPGVIYGEGKDPVSIVAPLRDVLDAWHKGHNTILHLSHDKGKDTVMIKSIDHDPVSDDAIHVDFMRINMTHEIEVEIPIILKGTPKGVKEQGGILEHLIREIKVSGLPNKIPHDITIDVAGLEIHAVIHVKDVPVPAGIEFVDVKDDDTLAHIVLPRAEKEEEAPAEGETAAEPELSVEKGKKDEEGEEAAGDGKAESKK